MYVPIAQAGDSAVRAAHTYFQVSWVVKATGLTAQLRERIREELGAVDPLLPVTAMRSMDEIKARAMAIETFQMTLLTAFALTGLLLAAAGVYGLVTYNVAQRTREFGIRLALGATRQRVLALVLRQAAVLAAVGVALGGAASLLGGSAMASFVFGVDTSDPTTLLIVAAILLIVVVVASLQPAFKAVRVNPVTALRR
jgi:ABC-type antimicrobial peptide transport system permease subunit